jgi:hypothetical protein
MFNTRHKLELMKILNELSSDNHYSPELSLYTCLPVIVDTACLDISEIFCLNSCVKPKSKDIGTQAHDKFVST